MRNRTSYLTLLSVLALAACDPPPPNPGCLPGMICPDAPIVDAGPMPGDTADAPRDTPDAGTVLPTCGSVGQVGGACRTPGNTCASGLTCQPEFVPMGAESTLRGIFDIPQGAPIPGSDFFTIVDPADPADDVPFHAFTNSLCTATCDTRLEGMETMASGELDTCGPCAACTTQLGQLGVVPSYIFLANTTAGRPFGTSTGFCRANCTFNPDTNGGCPAGLTCSPASLTCVEACETDAECQFTFEATRRGELVTVLDPAGGTCNTTTGRCDAGTGTTTVGDPCEGSSECSEDVGLCLRGGTCGEYNCGFATDTAMDGTCDGGAGVCLPQSPDNATICIQGCRTAMDCNPGSACLPLTTAAGGAVSIGPMMFSGICLGLCDIVPSDADGTGPLTTADDDLINCRAEERCDMPDPTADDLDPDGVCRPTCTTDTDCTGTDERCEMVPTTSYGFCRVPDQLCSAAGLDDDCFLGQRCDLLAQDGNNGLCVDGCTADTDCDAGDTCDTTRGVCRTPCTAGGTECTPMVETCIANLCEQLTTM